MTDEQNWAELTPEETLKATGILYSDLKDLIVFGVFPNGTVGTLFTSNSSSMNLMWILKAMDWDAVSENEDPLPLTTDVYESLKDQLDDDKSLHPVCRQALKQMTNMNHIIVAGLTEAHELTMATSKDVNFMMTSFCVDWFRFQLLNQMTTAAQQQAQQAQQAAQQQGAQQKAPQKQAQAKK